MKITIRAIRGQGSEMTIPQLKFANKCIIEYIECSRGLIRSYSGVSIVEWESIKIGCDISKNGQGNVFAVVYFE